MKQTKEIAARIAGLVFALCLAMGAQAEGARAAASIAPVHSLLAGVMHGVGEEPSLMISPKQSPHHLQLSPSQVRALHNADLFFYIGGGTEGFSSRILESLPKSVGQVVFTEAPEITLLPYREGEHHDEHGDEHGDAHHDDHDDHDKHDDHDDHDKHDEHGHEKHDDHDDHDKHDDHDEHEGHDHGAHDVHIWLDIDRARLMVKIMARELAKADPAHRAAYEKNARELDAKLAALDAELAQTLKNARGKHFAVAHDAYQYFERKYGLEQPVSLQGGFAEQLSAKRLSEARATVREHNIRCVFREPQIQARYIEALTEGTDLSITVGVADPLGANIAPGAQHYFTLLRQLAKAFADCL